MKNFYKKTDGLRLNILESIFLAKSGHPGGCLSSIDLIYYIFKNFLNYKKKFYRKRNRNYFVLSKGHCAPALYAVAQEFRIITKHEMLSLRKINSLAQGHTHLTKENLWMGANTGSLGQGFSFAIGYAIGLKKLKSNKKVFTILGDGELQEGEIWEGAMFSSHHKLNNLCAIIDYNKLQSDEKVRNIMNVEPLKQKWLSFGWRVISINGHNYSQIKKAFDNFIKKPQKKPTMIIANTVKGKGIKFMEGDPLWHGSVKISKDQFDKAVNEIKNKYEK